MIHLFQQYVVSSSSPNNWMVLPVTLVTGYVFSYLRLPTSVVSAIREYVTSINYREMGCKYKSRL
jgi:hypothetical protein